MSVESNGTGFSVTSYLGEYELRYVDDFVSALVDVLREGDVLLIDRNVQRIFKKRIGTKFSSYRAILLDPAEGLKSYEGVIPIISQLIEGGFKKDHRLVAIGGGITQDVTAFIASIMYRGVGWIFVPTNLLSQCDSCIGSKTSINFGEFKNQLGGFYPPRLILSDSSFRKTLDAREISSGVGEMAHYFLIDGEASFRVLEEGIDEALSGGDVLSRFVERSLLIKKAMIEKDEFDRGPRNVFNYGHSFGHALEGYTRFAIPHGVAVAYGMDVANSLSVKLGLMGKSIQERVHLVLRKIWMGTEFPEIDVSRYIEILRKDKKNIGSSVRVVLSREIGNMFLDRIDIDDRFRETLEDRFSLYRRDRT
jgi:3-dehydroquinate synthase